jgi:hypothetical protein
VWIGYASVKTAENVTKSVRPYSIGVSQSIMPLDRMTETSARVCAALQEGTFRSYGRGSLLTQIRSEKIGLNAFLTDRHVPGFTAACDCGWRQQTAKHILMFCRDVSGSGYTNSLIGGKGTQVGLRHRSPSYLLAKLCNLPAALPS